MNATGLPDGEGAAANVTEQTRRVGPRIIRRRSPIHGHGVFAARDLPKGSRVIEYKGRRLTHTQADGMHGNDAESGHTFLFTLNDKYLIDGGDGGNSARWINHGCAPNCEASVAPDPRGDPRRDRVFIDTRRAIRAGEELTYDYAITIEERQTPRLKRLWRCRCGAKTCTGTMLKPKR